MKNILIKYCYLMVVPLALLFFTGCEKEEVLKQQNDINKTSITQNRVDVANISTLQNFIHTKAKGSFKKGKGSVSYVETQFGYVVLDNIIETIDEVGNTNYTLKLLPKKPEPNKFYNLIVKTQENSEKLESYVLEYDMEPEFAEGFFLGQQTMDQYQGVIKKYTSDYFIGELFSKAAQPPCPCEELPVNPDGIGDADDHDSGNNDNNNNNNSGGGSNSDSGNTGTGNNSDSGTGGSSVFCTLDIVEPCTQSGSHEDYCPTEYSIALSCTTVIHKSNQSKRNRCNIDEYSNCTGSSAGLMGVDMLQLYSYLALTPETGFWLLNPDHQNIADAMSNFLWEFRFDEDELGLAKVFCRQLAGKFAREELSSGQVKGLLRADISFEKIKVYASLTEAQNEGLISIEEMEGLFSLMDRYQDSSEKLDFVEEALRILTNGNTQQKRFVQAVFEDNIPLAFSIALEGATYEQCCDPNEDIAVKMAWFTGSIVYGFHDAMFNLVKMTEDLFYTDEEEGKFVKIIMENSGVTVPAEISDETIGRLFKVRYEGLEMRAVPTGPWYQSFIDAAVTFLDIIAVLAPSSNGGAFLAAKGGGIITANVLSDYLKVLAKGNWKTVNESMSDAAKSYQEFISKRNWNESFEMPGPVKFDGIKGGVLVEAKSGMLNFVDANGNFKPFFTGKEAIIDQARRQRQAAGDLPIEWHFEHDIVRQTFERLLEEFPFDIKFIHTPR